MNGLTEFDRQVLLGELAKARKDGERGRRQTETAEQRVEQLAAVLRERGASEQEIEHALAGPGIQIVR